MDGRPGRNVDDVGLDRVISDGPRGVRVLPGRSRLNPSAPDVPFVLLFHSDSVNRLPIGIRDGGSRGFHESNQKDEDRKILRSKTNGSVFLD